MNELKQGFAPFYDGDSRVLILGSFPSVKSRQVEFYYGNPQNAFWKILSNFFGQPLPQTTDEKKQLLKANGVALWDVVCCCQIVGSSDSTITNYTVADIPALLQKSNIKCILLNGGTAAKIFYKYFPNLQLPTIKLPSTSPANTKKKDEEWYDALRTAFGRP
jgi:hypoxanthine-DNA glycosylase